MTPKIIAPDRPDCPVRTVSTVRPDDAGGELPDSAYGIPECREYPLLTAEHVRTAEACFRYAPPEKKAALARRILARAAQLGIEIDSRTLRGRGGEKG